MKKTILAIETSCDDTGIAVVHAEGPSTGLGQMAFPKFKVLKNLVSSQIKIHRPFGGVVPNLAKREHLKNLPILYRKIFGKEQVANGKLFKNHKQLAISYKPDIIAVTVGPGLEPALWAGITFAQELVKSLISVDSNNQPLLIGVNHLEGHLYSFLLPQQKKTASSKFKVQSSKLLFPAIVLLVSGGHTALLLMKDIKTWERLGETRDDAAGEAFDKVARMLGLPYPGGPEIEKLARKGNPEAISFPKPMLNQKNYDFSFSGLKTSVFYYLRDNLPMNNESITNIRIRKFEKNSLFADVAASFQKTAIDVLIAKTMRAAKEFGARSIILCGGVAANKELRKRLKAECDMFHFTFHCPFIEYNNDNAAMIAAAGYFASLRRKKLPMKADGNLNI